MAIRNLTREMHRLNDAVGSQIDLLPADLGLLDLLARDGAMAPRDIVARTGIHPATLTGMLDRLERGGWLSRRPDPGDRRRIIVEAATGREAEVARIYAPMSKALKEICADYSDEELARIIGFLERAADAGNESVSQVHEETPSPE